MNKTDDIETAISLSMPDEPVSLSYAEELLYAKFPVLRNEDRRWVYAAFMNLEKDGKIRYVGCDHGWHEGGCKVELAR